MVLHIASFLHHLLLHHVGLYVVWVLIHHHVVVIGTVGQRPAHALSHGLVHIMLIRGIWHTANHIAAGHHLNILLVCSVLVLVVRRGAQILVEDYLAVGLVRVFLYDEQ